MSRSAGLAALLALGLFAKRVVTAPASTHRSDPSVSLSPRIIAFSAFLNGSKISWGSCDSFGVNGTDINYECAYLNVPMDYHDDSAGNARLAVIKLAATQNKLGTVFFNPGNPLHLPLVLSHRYPIFTGGPGGSGLTAVSELTQVFIQGLHGAFDVISWDPRGVGQTL